MPAAQLIPAAGKFWKLQLIHSCSENLTRALARVLPIRKFWERWKILEVGKNWK
jgi:hypothetical protein